MELDGSDNADSTPPLLGDHPALSQFIENMGLHYQDYGVPRIGGRIIGLLLVTPRPVPSEEMADALQVSRSSISTNLKTLLMAGLVEKVSFRGERVDYFVPTESLWQKALEMRLSSILPLRSIAVQGLEGLDDQHPARPRLNQMIAWVDEVEAFVEHMRESMQSLQEVPARSG